MIVNIDHYNLCAPTEQISALKSFYVDVLGLSEGHRPTLSKNGYWLYQGKHALLHLSEDNAIESKQSGGCFNHIAFRCQGVSEMLKTLEDNDVEYELRELPDLSQIQIFCRDPCDIRIELNFLNEVL